MPRICSEFQTHSQLCPKYGGLGRRLTKITYQSHDTMFYIPNLWSLTWALHSRVVTHSIWHICFRLINRDASRYWSSIEDLTKYFPNSPVCATGGTKINAEFPINSSSQSINKSVNGGRTNLESERPRVGPRGCSGYCRRKTKSHLYDTKAVIEWISAYIFVRKQPAILKRLH